MEIVKLLACHIGTMVLVVNLIFLIYGEMKKVDINFVVSSGAGMFLGFNSFCIHWGYFG